jgi:hypothetical protein
MGLEIFIVHGCASELSQLAEEGTIIRLRLLNRRSPSGNSAGAVPWRHQRQHQSDYRY